MRLPASLSEHRCSAGQQSLLKGRSSKNYSNNACHYHSLVVICAFELAVEWTVKDSLKDSLLSLPCGEDMKLHWLTASLEHAGEISTEKLSCPVRFEDLLYRLTILLSGLCSVMWTVNLSFSSVYFTSCFNAIWFWFLYSLHHIYNGELAIIPHTAFWTTQNYRKGNSLTAT